jgi:hypothetical protein
MAVPSFAAITWAWRSGVRTFQAQRRLIRQALQAGAADEIDALMLELVDQLAATSA